MRVARALPLIVCALAAFGALPATPALGAPVIGEGLDITGASSLADGPDTGRGLEIAVLDLGFGRSIGARQEQGELPPEARLETRSFDAARGLAGANAFGNRTSHGEQVAQVVYDYAPGAKYIFVNYHTPAEFLSAARWLAERRPDIVVHANNLLEGPFDGTGPAALAVDRVAATGALWFNSAGNYARQHWQGVWSDTDLDRSLDATTAWTFTRRKGETITVAASWANDEGTEPSDLDLVLERSGPSGWSAVRESRRRQTEGAAASEALTGVVAPADGTYRTRLSWVAGPEPEGPIALFSRELALAEIGPTLGGSVPTPADADGAIAVGAVDWRTDALKAYSSRGPSPDGRQKPDLVAPTGTAIRGPVGRRGVGGTSIAAPNAAGAAAVLWWALRRAGIRASASAVREELLGRARDLGSPGPDPRFGHGLVRLDDEPPHVELALPAGPARGRMRIGARIADGSAIRSSALAIDGLRVQLRAGGAPVTVAWIDSTRLADGAHTVDVSALDAVRNRGTATGRIVIDNTAPSLVVQPPRIGAPRARTRRVDVEVAASDSLAPRVRVEVSASRRGGGTRVRTLTTEADTAQVVSLGRLAAGAWTLRLTATDSAGNTTVVRRRVVVAVPRQTSPTDPTGQEPGP